LSSSTKSATSTITEAAVSTYEDELH